MGSKDKLKRFAENETFRCLLQPEAASVLAKPEGSRELVLRDHAILEFFRKHLLCHFNDLGGVIIVLCEDQCFGDVFPFLFTVRI